MMDSAETKSSSSGFAFTRAAPSQRYRDLIALYADMHDHGDRQRGKAAAKTFSGSSLERQAPRIRMLTQSQKARTLLDYGCGKASLHGQKPVTIEGAQYPDIAVYWGLDAITLYDPAYAPYTRLPEGRFDGVICTDVLEHCPKEDIPWILDEIFGYAGRFVFANVACFPAMKTLPNGENAHCTIEGPEWWEARLIEASARHPDPAFFILLEIEQKQADGANRYKFLHLAGRAGKVKRPEAAAAPRAAE
jgi:hypothetical protein